MFLDETEVSPGLTDKETFELLKDLNFTDIKYRSILRWIKAMTKIYKI